MAPIPQGGILGLSFSTNNQQVDFDRPSFPPTGAMLAKTFWAGLEKKPKSTYPSFMEYLGVQYGPYLQKYSLYVKRSIVSTRTDPAKARQDRDNHGLFILGGGEEFTQLYQGGLTTVPLPRSGESIVLGIGQRLGSPSGLALALVNHHEFSTRVLGNLHETTCWRARNLKGDGINWRPPRIKLLHTQGH